MSVQSILKRIRHHRPFPTPILRIRFPNRARMHNLSRLATDPNFAKLSEHEQHDALNSLMKDPGSPGNLKSIQSAIKDRVELETNSNFQHLPASTRSQVLDLMNQYALDPDN